MELWDIYNKDRELTGRTMERNHWDMAPGEYHLTVLALVTNADGRILVTRRALDKPWAAGCWELPGGAVQAGETGSQAILREVREETGLDLAESQGEVIFSYRRDNPEERDNYFVDLYRFSANFDLEDITLDPKETIDVRLLTVREIEALGKEKLFLHFDSLREAFDQL